MRIAHSGSSLLCVVQQLLSLTFSSKLQKLRPHSLQTLVFAMAGPDENHSVSDNAEAAEDAKFGFTRPEMYTKPLSGTVDPYDRHVFLCWGRHENWPSRVEDSDSDLLPMLLSVIFQTRKHDIKVKTRLTICEGREGTDFADGDVLIFPDMVKYRGLTESTVDNFGEDVLVNGNPWSSGEHEPLTGSYVFVCAHANRDRRCGVCGPVLIEKFEKEIEHRGLKDQVFVKACSHIGGHKYAGNLIIFSPDSEGKLAGHWYGYVTPDDVSELLDLHIGKGEIIERLWRGQMGVYPEEGEKAEEKEKEKHKEKKKHHEETEQEKHKERKKHREEMKSPNGEMKKSKKEHQEIKSREIKETAPSCCQGANGAPCCQDESSEQKKKKVSSWMGKWEQKDVITVAAVVGAIATVAVAYFGFYRKKKSG